MTRELSDEQWAAVRRFIPSRERKRARGQRGRPWGDARAVLDGVLWVLRTGAPWSELPRRYPPRSTCHRRFQAWQRQGVFCRILRGLTKRLQAACLLDLSEAFIDGSHAGAKRGGALVGRTRRGNATKIMAIADGHSLPIAVSIASGQRHEAPLVLETLQARFTRVLPERLVGDCAYDSDGLDAELRTRDVEMIAPHHPRRRRKTQDGRPLRRYWRRWQVERLFAWLFSFRRLVTRYEHHAANFLGMLQLACIAILSRRCAASS
jgi:transposase